MTVNEVIKSYGGWSNLIKNGLMVYKGSESMKKAYQSLLHRLTEDQPRLERSIPEIEEEKDRIVDALESLAGVLLKSSGPKAAAGEIDSNKESYAASLLAGSYSISVVRSSFQGVIASLGELENAAVKEELPKTAGYCKDAIGTLKAFDTYFVGPEDARSAREERITAMITDLDALIEGGDEEARAVKSVHYTAFLMDILANWRDRLILRDKLPAFSEALRNLDGQVQAELEKIESEIDSLKKLAGIADIVGLILKQILPAPGIH